MELILIEDRTAAVLVINRHLGLSLKRTFGIIAALHGTRHKVDILLIAVSCCIFASQPRSDPQFITNNGKSSCF
ncbi:hypothetical protein D3C73_1239950 [compost metagenome]